MSALGDLLKELFPLRAMGTQTYEAGKAAFPQAAKFGSDLINGIKRLMGGATASPSSGNATGVTPPNSGGSGRKPLPGWPPPPASGSGVPSTSSSAAAGKQAGNLFDALFRITQPLRDLYNGFQTLKAKVSATATALNPIANLRSLGSFAKFLVTGTPPPQPSQTGMKGMSGTTGGNQGQNQHPSTAQQTRAVAESPKLLAGLNDTLNSVIFRYLKYKFVLEQITGLFHRLTFSLSDANRDLAKWNGSISASFARLDISRMKLDIRQGAATAGTTNELNNQLAAFLKELQPIREGVGTISNMLGISLLKIGTSIVQSVRAIAEKVPLLGGAVAALKAIEAELQKNGQKGFIGNTAFDVIGRATKPRDPQLIGDQAKANDVFLKPRRGGK